MTIFTVYDLLKEWWVSKGIFKETFCNLQQQQQTYLDKGKKQHGISHYLSDSEENLTYKISQRLDFHLNQIYCIRTIISTDRRLEAPGELGVSSMGYREEIKPIPSYLAPRTELSAATSLELPLKLNTKKSVMYLKGAFYPQYK